MKKCQRTVVLIVHFENALFVYNLKIRIFHVILFANETLPIILFKIAADQ